MTWLRKSGEKLTPDFIEEDFLCAIQTSIVRSYYFRNKLLEISRISAMEENELGYDGVLNSLVPFYIQSKRSSFYTQHFSGGLAKERNKVKLPTENGFFAFELLKDGKHFRQHNCLYELSLDASAAYVAPIFYKSSVLSALKTLDRNVLPVHYADIEILDMAGSTYRFLRRRFFHQSITIPPHQRIDDNSISHHYSYSRDFRIGFHSDPINLENSKSSVFVDFITNILNKESSKEELDKTIDQIFKKLPSFFGLTSESSKFTKILRNTINRVFIMQDRFPFGKILSELTMIDKLLIIEDILYSYFNIHQFIRYEHKSNW